MADGPTGAPAGGPSTPAPAAAAPAGAPAPGAAPAKASAPKPAPKPAAAAPSSSGTRAPDGRFLPKEGTQGAVKEDPEAPPGETKAEKEYRLKRKLKVYGKDEEVDYSEEDIVRELQKGRALQAKQKEWRDGQAKAQRLFELAQSNPEAFLRELGQDPDQWASKRLAQKAQLGAMTDEERALHEAKQKLAHYEAKEKQQAEEQQKTEKAQKQQALVANNSKKFMEGLEKVGLPKSYETLYLMAETQKLAMDDGIEYTPEELAKETEHRVDQFTERYLGSLDGKALAKKLGPKRVQSILEASLEEFQAGQDFAAPAAKSAPEPVRKTEEPEFIDEYEVSRRLRNLR
jgi:hypothetical protein